MTVCNSPLRRFSDSYSLDARLSGILGGGRLLMYDSGYTYMTFVRCAFVLAQLRVSILKSSLSTKAVVGFPYASSYGQSKEGVRSLTAQRSLSICTPL